MMYEGKVPDERTGFRDPDLEIWHREHGFEYPVGEQASRDFSLRHRNKYGYNCPGVDIDWPYLEYNHCLAVALIDYKLREGLRGDVPDKNTANNRALNDLCHERVLNCTVFYMKQPWTFRVFPMNAKAQQLVPKKQLLTEAEYVAWLYEIRNFTVSEHITSQLDNEIRWESLLPPPHKSKGKKSRDKSPYTLFDQDPILQQKWEVPV